MNQEHAGLQQSQSGEEAAEGLRKPYVKPHLEKLGDLRTLTLGVSGAPTDASGGQINQRTPP